LVIHCSLCLVVVDGMCWVMMGVVIVFGEGLGFAVGVVIVLNSFRLWPLHELVHVVLYVLQVLLSGGVGELVGF